MTATADEISTWLQTNTEPAVPAARADAAAREIADSWAEGDLDYETVADILGGHLTNDEPRPKDLADDLAAAFGLTLEV